MDEIDNVMRVYLENNALISLGDLVAKQQAEIEMLKGVVRGLDGLLKSNQIPGYLGLSNDIEELLNKEK